MEFELATLNGDLIQKQAAGDILALNDGTGAFGLSLTPEQAGRLVATRTDALTQTGRIEFGSGVIGKLIRAFCDSPYITQRSYEETLHDLVEIFYACKNETGDRIGDDDLIALMKAAFDGPCAGSVELLAGQSAYELARMAGGAYGAGLGREAAPDAAPADALDDSETPAGGRHE